MRSQPATPTPDTAAGEPSNIRISQPYEHRPGEYRCRLTIDGCRKWAPTAATPERAKRLAQAAAARYRREQPLTVADLLNRYEQYMTAKGNKPRSITTTLYRLHGFFMEPGLPALSLTSRRCAGYYNTLTGKQKADTHRNALAEARTFCKWLVKQGTLKANPIDGIEPIGRRRKGKPQLHIDEAKRWLAVAQERADRGDTGAVAAMVTLLMGLRASEVTSRTVRDLDNGGRLLWIPDSKTEAGRRRVEVPEILRPYLQALTRDKLPMAPLFGSHWRDWPRRWVQKICRAARVPKVCAHGMRGLFATLGLQAGTAPHVVAATLGHETPRTTCDHYAAPGSAEVAPRRRAVAALLP
ncbi:MAG: site-specific integrase [Polyangia bacterium]